MIFSFDNMFDNNIMFTQLIYSICMTTNVCSIIYLHVLVINWFYLYKLKQWMTQKMLHKFSYKLIKDSITFVCIIVLMVILTSLIFVLRTERYALINFVPLWKAEANCDHVLSEIWVICWRKRAKKLYVERKGPKISRRVNIESYVNFLK